MLLAVSGSPSGIQLAVGAMSREFKLTVYDAQYLELARRRNMALATLDKDLRRTAKKAAVPIDGSVLTSLQTFRAPCA